MGTTWRVSAGDLAAVLRMLMAWLLLASHPVVEYSVLTDMFGNTTLQPYLHSSYSAGQQQLALCNYDVVDYVRKPVPGVGGGYRPLPPWPKNISWRRRRRFRALYDKDVMSRIADDDFRYMPCTLYDFFESHESDVTHDIMLLENQIPWQVVEAVMGFTPVTLESVIVSWKERLVDRVVIRGGPAVELDPSYEPRTCLDSSKFTEVADKDEKIKALLDSVPKSKIDAFLSMAPLSLDNTRASWHVNMAALELCTTPDFFDREDATYLDSVACSEEDVHQLRTKRILQGAGLTDKEVLKILHQHPQQPARRALLCEARNPILLGIPSQSHDGFPAASTSTHTFNSRRCAASFLASQEDNRITRQAEHNLPLPGYPYAFTLSPIGGEKHIPKQWPTTLKNTAEPVEMQPTTSKPPSKNGPFLSGLALPTPRNVKAYHQSCPSGV
ncbi:hypothetical protein HU200_066509 [Digitaria exilis]|uniref:Uncharacterized protein n=1 Tax=Digitaria exilis TaxID=1010633 RepID=A0A835DTT2_9POAL|nr:hypothetical protein HU200_066509 [Digitaria exilis]